MPEDATTTLRQMVTFALKALGAAGVPGASVAEEAVDMVAKRLDARRAEAALRQALNAAADRLRQEAYILADMASDPQTRQAWQWLAQALAPDQLPLRDLPSLLEAAHDALDAADATALVHAVQKQLPTPLPSEVRAQAARRYLELVWAYLWREPAWRNALQGLFTREIYEQLQNLSKAIERLPLVTAKAVLKAWEDQEARNAWEALKPAVVPARPVGSDFIFHELKAQYRLIPYRGREFFKLRDRLVAWAQSLAEDPEQRVGLAWLYGPGGAGKTRLLVETAAALQGQGWQVAFVPEPGDLTPEKWRTYARYWVSAPQPTLLVVDYAESRPEDALLALLNEAVTQAKDRTAPLALVLLTRPRPEETTLELILREWRTKGTEDLRSRLLQKRKMKRAPLPSLGNDERQDLFQAAVDAFRARLQVPDETPRVTYEEEALPRRPLALVLLAFLAAQGHRL
ncbi:MAG: hypothetical protein GXO55_04060, partial [Chloroflexi bacterium]|nr:hypothetical protein [Chloroflexota bacterium]